MLLVIWTFILAILPKLIFALLAAIGVGVVTYTGLGFIIDSAQNVILQNYNNVGTDALAIMNIANADQAIKIILSSYTAGIAIKSTVGGLKHFRLQ